MTTSWSEVVTTALLGTDRRPLPADSAAAGAGGDRPAPSTLLLETAARERARRRSARPLARCAAPSVAPDDLASWAPVAAQELLERLLAGAVPELVNAWLAAAAARQVRPAPSHWSGLAALAATRTDVDRAVLAQALGPAGVWFVRQNPAWRRLADTLDQPVPSNQPAQPATPRVLPDEAAVAARPELALDVPAPWPRELAVAALRVLLTGQLGWRSVRYGAAVGARLAAADADLLTQAGDALATSAGRPTPVLPLLQEAVAAAAAAATDRAAVDAVFDTPPPPDPSAHQERL